MLKIFSKNPNYLAKVVAISQIRKHSNADRLSCVNILGNNIITSTAKVGDLYVFFPLECAINKEYLAYTNSFASPELNNDKAVKGFFGNTGRVRALKLRGEKSEGYIASVSSIESWLNSKGINFKFTQDHINTDFDQIGDILLCEKYINRQTLIDAQKAQARDRQTKKAVRVSKIIPNQFRFHNDTEQLKRNIHRISPEDVITISYKLHGTSAVFSNVLCKKPLKWYEKLLTRLGINIVDSHYDYVWSSRRVIKNEYADVKLPGYYNVDIWEHTANSLKDKISNGISLYGEIVNQLPNGAWIQKDYDYGLAPHKSDFYVYRITSTAYDGKVTEFSTVQMLDYCQRNFLNVVPIFYRGKAKDLFPELSLGEHWHQSFLEKLMEKYTEKKCYMCKNNVPEEGVVIVKEGPTFEAFKLKSFAFLERETAELDSGATNIEDEQLGNDEVPLAC